MTIATPDQAHQFLMQRLNYERTPARKEDFHLERMVRLLEMMQNPQSAAPVIHLAGTKGKGSTASLLSHALVASGKRVGLYTSPHLTQLEERIRIDNIPCSPDAFVGLVNTLAPLVREMDSSGDAPTFFELSTALALLHFAQRQVDVIVLETGMGGRLDSTNVCDPVVSIITSVSFDHTRQLGATLEQIATEKSGIIKPRRPVVSGVMDPSARDVVRLTAAQLDSPVFQLGDSFWVEDVELTPAPATCFSYRSPERELPRFELGLLGAHQAANAALALAALELLARRSPPLYDWNDQVLRKAWRQARWPARIEVARTDPTVIIDVAHNVASVSALVDTLNRCFPRRESQARRLIVSISSDKDVSGVLSVLLPHFDEVMITRFTTNPRAVEPVKLADRARALALPRSPRLETSDSPLEAWQWAERRMEDEAAGSLTCIAGLFLPCGRVARRGA